MLMASVRTQQRDGHLRQGSGCVLLEELRHEGAGRGYARAHRIVKRDVAIVARHVTAPPTVLVVIHDAHHMLHATS